MTDLFDNTHDQFDELAKPRAIICDCGAHNGAHCDCEELPEFYIGQPAINLYDTEGFISKIKKNHNSSMMLIGAGGLQPINELFDIEYTNGTASRELSEGIIRPWIDKARRMERTSKTEAEMIAMTAAGEAEREKEATARNEARDEHTRAVLVWENENRDKVPTWAKAVIVASLVKDECDLMTDYHHSTTTESIILGFSKHTRDLFPEMRKAARNAPETEALADAPADAEHREKYSMGGGYYLKNGYRHSSGWKISKKELYNADSIKNLPSMARFCLAPQRAAKTLPRGDISAGNYNIESRYHDKRGFDFWVCVPAERMEREEFNSERNRCKDAGGWYCRAWAGDPGGFAFNDEIDARGFAGEPGPEPELPGPDEEGPTTGAPIVADKLRTMADKLSADIEGKRADRLTNTPKRLAQANSARTEADRLERVQRAMYALAAMHEAGKVPPVLMQYRTKKAIYEAMSSETEQVQNGFHAYYIETGKPRSKEPGPLALWETLKESAELFPAEDRELQREIEALQFSSIPGYFPTPPAVIEQMIEHAQLTPEMSVLEPSAGSGAILDALKAHDDTLRLSSYEMSYTLAGILERKGYKTIQYDFMAVRINSRHDRILMNPPFENQADIHHVMKAHDRFLKPGGRLVAVMSEGAFFNTNRAGTEFREWADKHGAESYRLPEGSFKPSGTGVATRIFIIDKE